MGRGGDGGVPDGQAHGGNVSHALHEPGLQVVIGDVQDLGGEHGTGVVHLKAGTISLGDNSLHIFPLGLTAIVFQYIPNVPVVSIQIYRSSSINSNLPIE